MKAKVYKLGWKVVDEDGGSCCQEDWEGKVGYHFSRKTRPRLDCGPLAVFKTKKAALDFFDCPETTFPCAFIPSKHKYLWCEVGERRDLFPPGTRFADEVILLKERRA